MRIFDTVQTFLDREARAIELESQAIDDNAERFYRTGEDPPGIKVSPFRAGRKFRDLAREED